MDCYLDEVSYKNIIEVINEKYFKKYLLNPNSTSNECSNIRADFNSARLTVEQLYIIISILEDRVRSFYESSGRIEFKIIDTINDLEHDIIEYNMKDEKRKKEHIQSVSLENIYKEMKEKNSLFKDINNLKELIKIMKEENYRDNVVKRFEYICKKLI